MYDEVGTPRATRPKPTINPLLPAAVATEIISPATPEPQTGPTPRNSFDDFNFDPQRFGGQKLPEGNYNLKVRRQVQNRHIEGTAEYNNYVEQNREQGKSFLPSVLAPDVRAQDLVNEFHGKGIYAPHNDIKQRRERVNTGRIIGKYWDYKLDGLVDTTWLMIVYSNSGTHVYPIHPFEEQ